MQGVPWLRQHVVAEAVGGQPRAAVRLRPLQSNRPRPARCRRAVCRVRPPASHGDPVRHRRAVAVRFASWSVCRASRYQSPTQRAGRVSRGNGRRGGPGATWAAAEGTLAGTWASVDLGLQSVAAARVRVRPIQRTIRRLAPARTPGWRPASAGRWAARVGDARDHRLRLRRRDTGRATNRRPARRQRSELAQGPDQRRNGRLSGPSVRNSGGA